MLLSEEITAASYIESRPEVFGELSNDPGSKEFQEMAELFEQLESMEGNKQQLGFVIDAVKNYVADAMRANYEDPRRVTDGLAAATARDVVMGYADAAGYADVVSAMDRMSLEVNQSHTPEAAAVVPKIAAVISR